MAALNRDEQVARLALQGELFTQDHLAKICSAYEGITYSKRDFLFRGGTWRGLRQRPAVLQANIKMLVTGHSDYSLTNLHEGALRLALGRQLRIWASNSKSNHGLTESFPIGLTNQTLESPAHEIFGNQKHIAEAMEVDRFSRPSLYANFSPHTAPRYRDGLLSLMQEKSLGILQKPEVSNRGRVRYLSDMRRHGFVVCPRGNGIDTCRLFEALAVGAVPILKRGEAPLWLRYFSNLPIILVDSWDELVDRPNRLFERKFFASEVAPVSASHWVDKLQTTALALNFSDFSPSSDSV